MTEPKPSRGKILVADGAEPVRSALVVSLCQAGFEVAETSEGPAALGLVQEGAIDVLVLGERLVGMPAQEVLRQATARGATVPIILCTDSWDVDRAAAAVREGAWDCLGRPFTETDLLAAVFPALTQGRTGGGRAREELLWQVVQKAQKMETAAVLAGRVVHDLNNLLTVVLGYSDIVQRSLPAGTTLWTAVEEIRRAANGGALLARELLALGRKDPYQPQSLDLNAILTRMGLLLRQVAGAHIKTVSKLESGLGLIRADPAEVDQVILNLVLNARDAMSSVERACTHAGMQAAEQASARLTLRTANLELAERSAEHPVAPGSYVLLQVSDTGCGMSGETQARLFEPFYTTKRAGQGTGLGLATVREILRRIGGQITVQSELGAGSTFSVYFPRLGPAPGTAANTQSQKSARPGTETILVLDDEPAVRDLFRRVLENRGHQVLLAATPTEAHKVCAEHAGPIDVLIADLVLPDMDGVQLARQVLALRPQLRVLFITGHPGHTLVQQAEAFPRAKILCKPFNPTTLLAELRELLNREE